MSEPEIPDPWVEAAAEALAAHYDSPAICDGIEGCNTDVARAALSAALPLMERALKAEALREAANDLMRQGIAATPRWLHDRADALEES